MPKAKLKSRGITALAKEISRQPSTGWVAWLLVATLLQIYNEKEQTEKGKIQNVQLEEKEKNQEKV